jgi:transcription elongation GreA/GreB family factor
MRITRRKSAELKMQDNEPVLYLTADGLKRLEERLARLKRVLPGYIAEAHRTAEYGDRSDNAEYKEAKFILRRTHRQIFTIEDKLKRASVISPEQNKSGIVRLGSTVILESKTGMRKTYRILGSQESNPEKGNISYKSPLGSALMNRGKGDMVAVKTGNGSQEYRIIEIN